MAEDINKLISDLKKLRDEYTKLTGKRAPLFDTSNLENTKAGIDAITESIEKAREKAAFLESGFNGIYGEIQGILSELEGTDAATKKVTKAFKGVESIARDLRNDQNDITKLSLKELKQRQQKLKSLEDEAKFQAEIVAQRYAGTKAAKDGLLLDKNGNLLNKSQLKARAAAFGVSVKTLQNDAAILAGREEEFSVLERTNKQLEERIKQEGRITELMGLGGAAVEAIGGALDKLGMGGLKEALGLDEVADKMREIAEEIEEAGGDADSFANKMAVLKGGIEEAGTQLIQNLKDPLAIAGFLATQLIDAIMSVDKQAGELAKNFGISYDAALGLKSELTSAANQSYLLNINSQGLVESFTTLNNLFGTFAQINSQTLEDFSRLTDEAYLSTEAASALYKTTILTGKGLEDSTKEFAGQAQALAMQNGLALNQKQILEAVQNISSATLLTLQGQPEALAEAVVNAKSLGVSLDKVEAIAGSLLQFESSISSELEAELLTGKQLNLERARAAALQGDIATVAEEIAKQTGSAADFAEMNVIQQEALAKSVGMTRDDLAKSLMEREAMAKLSGQEGKNAQERFNNLVKEVGMEEAKRQLGDEQLSNLYSQQNVQERFAAATSKLKDIFVAIAEPVLKIVSPLVDLVTNVLPLVNVVLSPVLFVFDKIASAVSWMVEGISKSVPLMAALGVAAYGYLATTQKTLVLRTAITAKQKAESVWAGITNTYEKSRVAIAATIDAIKTKGLLKTIADAAMSAYSSIAKIPFIGPVLGIAAAASAFALGRKYMSKGDDVVSPGYGKRTLMMEEGAIQLNDKDTVIAGTDLGGGGGGGGSINIAPLVERMIAVENILVQILNKEGEVYIDGSKVGKTLQLASSKMG